MDVSCPRMGKSPKSVQPTQPLCERPYTASLGHEVFRVDVGTHFQGLCRHHDQVLPTLRVRVARRRHPVLRVEYPSTRPRRFAFAHETREEQHLRCRQGLVQVLESLSRRLRRVCEHEACRGSRCLANERHGGLRESPRRLTGDDIDTDRLRGVQPLTDNRVRLVVIVQIDPHEEAPLALNTLIEFDRRRYGSVLLIFYEVAEAAD